MADAGKTVIVAALDGTFQREVRGLVFTEFADLNRYRCDYTTSFAGIWRRAEASASCGTSREADGCVFGVQRGRIVHEENRKRDRSEL